MGSIKRRLAQLERKRTGAGGLQNVHLLTETDDIPAMIAAGKASPDDLFIVMVAKDPLPEPSRAG